MSGGKMICADKKRLWASLMEMGRIGATPGGGVGRIALTELDKQARDLFVRWCEESGCTVRVDRMGNIFARRAGSDGTLVPVMTGSHLDTQPLGGKFDSIYGVLAGLEAVRAMNDAGVTTRVPIEVVMFFLRHLSAEAAAQTLKQALPFRDWIVAVGLDSSEVGHRFHADTDLARVALIQKLVAGHGRIRIDANQGYSRADAC